jgi:hypothetical protein
MKYQGTCKLDDRGNLAYNTIWVHFVTQVFTKKKNEIRILFYSLSSIVFFSLTSKINTLSQFIGFGRKLKALQYDDKNRGFTRLSITENSIH